MSVSDGMLMIGRLTVVSTLVARDSNKELLVSVVSPEGRTERQTDRQTDGQSATQYAAPS